MGRYDPPPRSFAFSGPKNTIVPALNAGTMAGNSLANIGFKKREEQRQVQNALRSQARKDKFNEVMSRHDSWESAVPDLYQSGLGEEAVAIEQKFKGTEAPSAVRTYQFFKDLPPEDQERMLTTMRAAKTFDTGSGYAVQSQAEPTRATPISGAERQLKPEQRPDYLAEKKITEAEASAQAEAKIQLADAKLQKDEGLAHIDEIMSHPGLEDSFGWKSKFPTIPASDRADFEARLKQLQDSVFISNRQALKGGGAITDFEGTKAENAKLRAEQATSAKAFREAMKDYKKWVNLGFKKLENQARGDFSVQESSPKYSIGDTVEKGGKQYRIKTLKPDGTPDEVDPL